MDFLRRHGFMMGCTLAAAVGIVLGVTGLRAMPKVRDELRKVETVYRNLDGLQAGAVNYERIEAEKRRNEVFVEDGDKIMERATSLYRNALEKGSEGEEEPYRFKFLVPDVVPYGDKETRSRFQRAYTDAMEELLKSLNYGGPATAVSVTLMEERIRDEQLEERERSMGGAGAEAGATASGPARTPAGVLTLAGVKESAQARADIVEARRIWCYATHFNNEKPPLRFSSLDFDTKLRATGTIEAPPIEEVWRAQIGYWIQKDVIDAIVALNSAAADEARQKGEDVWVGTMPVKEVISIRVGPDYVPPEGEGGLEQAAAPGGYDPATPAGTAESVFTGRGSTATYEVMQYTLKLVMDQRDIPALVDRICKDSLHTLLRVSYEAVPPNRAMTGKIYGSEPAVNVVMDFEVIMLGEVFRRVMPPEVRATYEFIKCRDIDECPTGKEEG